jgi:hypothetical protein
MPPWHLTLNICASNSLSIPNYRLTEHHELHG